MHASSEARTHQLSFEQAKTVHTLESTANMFGYKPPSLGFNQAFSVTFYGIGAGSIPKRRQWSEISGCFKLQPHKHPLYSRIGLS
jgi:hypothetical protein